MANKGVLILFLVIGIILIITDLSKNSAACPPQKVIYRYVPRTFDQEQDEPVYPSDIFKAMFTQPSAWNNGLTDYEMRRNLSVNNFFVSQM